AGVSDDGSRVVLNLSEAGSEIGDIRVLDAATGKLLPDIIPHSGWGHFAGGSNSEIFYQQLKSYDFRDPEFMMNAPNKLHIVGTSVSDDITVVSSAKDPELNIPAASLAIVHSFKDSPYMILGIYTVDNNVTRHYAPRSELRSKKINWRPLTAVEDEIRNYFVKGSDIFFVTGKGNPRFKLIKTSLKDPDLKTAVTIVEGDEEWQLSPDNFAQTKDHLLFAKSKNELIAKTFIYEFKTGRISEVSVPLSGNIFPRSLSEHDNEAALINSGWNTPDNIFKYDVKNRILSEGVFHSSARFSGLKDVVFEEVEVMSHDGVAVPLSIVYKKSLLKKDGSNTVYMQGYGAFGEVAYRPFFDQSYLPLLERGVVLAFAHVRGGGEKGSEWHLAGKKETKPNTWKDLNACAEWLIRNKYTAAERFGISGASAGGILIGRAITERPDLYRVAIPKVGVLNSLRAEFAPGGEGLVPEFGSITNKKDFPALYKMDAYQHVQDKVKYPAQLITTGFNDPRVPSWLPAKFAAKMQAKNGSANPVFLDVDFGTGHFGAATAKERYAQIAKEYAFLLWQTGHPEFQP
ncbi:MAG: prolyl oligopeptidase family serine peptidase, partial [Acidobacteria bacterium]|nr:prolyl oligopeptidase family serine peptidase [Acidobacteriota bacterium]